MVKVCDVEIEVLWEMWVKNDFFSVRNMVVVLLD